MKTPSIIIGVVLTVLMIENAIAITWVESPVNAWTYHRKQVQYPWGQYPPPTYYPTDVSELFPAWREGCCGTEFVEYNGPDTGTFSTDQAVTGFHTFETWVISDFDQELLFVNSGSGGHAVFVDDVFLTGNENGVDAFGVLSLQAGVPCNLKLTSHRNVRTSKYIYASLLVDGQTLEELPTVRVQALRDIVVPEPATIFLCLISVCLALTMRN